MKRQMRATTQAPQDAAVLDVNPGDYSRIAEILANRRNNPVYSVGQGVAQAGGDILAALLEKQAADKQQQAETQKYGELTKAMLMSAEAGNNDQGPPMPPSMTRNMAFSELAKTQPRMAVENFGALNEIAQNAAPAKTPSQWNQKEGPRGSAYLEDQYGNIKPLVGAEPKSGLLSPEEEAQKVRIANASRNDTRPPKMANYYDEAGAPVTVDLNNPDDIDRIRTEGLSNRGVSEGERASSGYLQRMVASEAELEKLMNNGFDPTGLAERNARGVPLVGNYLVSPEFRQYEQQKKDWVRAKLRKESGAVIGEDEMAAEISTYFPEPGDDEQTIANKRKSRINAERQLATGAGALGRGRLRELNELEKALTQPTPQAPQLPPEAMQNLPPGAKMVGGKVIGANGKELEWRP
jgi:hypothetical protein